MELGEYQRQAVATNRNDLNPSSPEGLVPPLFGLASETGSILNIYKKVLRDGIDRAHATDYLKQELGDLLWYVAIAAEAHGLNLEDIAQENLKRTRSRYPTTPMHEAIARLPSLDVGYPPEECFPRRAVVEFIETKVAGRPAKVAVKLVAAEPNPFPDGHRTIQTAKGPREIGFKIGGELGDALNDNAVVEDGYRYHDAVHMGFMAVLGWSPTMRGLLQVKRRSNARIDENEDGARALFAEEGLSAVLAQLSKSRLEFQSDLSVNTEVLSVVKAIVNGLEVKYAPDWLWASAIKQGFSAMAELKRNRGGFVEANLDARTLTFSKDAKTFGVPVGGT